MSSLIKGLFGVVLVAFVSSTGWSNESCLDLFGSRPTSRYTPALQDLARLKMRIDLQRGNGSRALSSRALFSRYREKELELLNVLNEFDLRLALSGAIAEFQRVRDRDLQDSVEKEERARPLRVTTIDGSQMIMNPVHTGDYRRVALDSRSGQLEPVYVQGLIGITKPFSLSSTLTTNFVWRKVLAAAKLRFPAIDVKRLEIPDGDDLFPLTSVTWFEIEKWLKLLNDLAAANDPIVTQLFPRHVPGMKYRLPTEAEWGLVVNQGPFHAEPLPTLEQLKPYAWVGVEGGYNVKQVATKQPFVIQGELYYDLFGNVGQWMTERYGPLEDGLDPHPNQKGPGHLWLGGNYTSQPGGCFLRNAAMGDLRASTIGFRIAADYAR